MKHILSLFLAVALVGTACGQSVPVVTLPAAPVPVVPVNPTTPTVLGVNQFYVIQASAPVIVLASPQGVVKVAAETGPLRMRGIFADGTGQMETRTFKGPNLYIVEASSDGTCELLVVPSMDPASVIRRTLSTQAPAPVVPPPPPTPPADPLTQAFSDALKADGQPVSVAATLAKLYRSVASTTVNNKALVTYADLFSNVKTVQDALVAPASNVKLRTLIAQQFIAAFGSDQTAAINRDLAASTFNAIAKSLEGVK